MYLFLSYSNVVFLLLDVYSVLFDLPPAIFVKLHNR